MSAPFCRLPLLNKFEKVMVCRICRGRRPDVPLMIKNIKIFIEIREFL